MHKKPDMSLEVRSYSDVLEFFPGNLSICVLIFWSFKDSDFPTVFPGNVSICVLLCLFLPLILSLKVQTAVS